jgi:hypothetical protein
MPELDERERRELAEFLQTLRLEDAERANEPT